MQLQSSNGSHEGEAETQAGLDVGGSGSHDWRAGACRARVGTSADGRSGNDSSVLGNIVARNVVGGHGLGRLIARLGRLGRLLLGWRLLSGRSKGNLRDSVLSADNTSGAAARDRSTLSDARLSNSGVNDNGGDISGGHGSWGDSNDLRNGLGTSGNAGVFLDIGSADTLEEADRVGNGLVIVTEGVQAAENVLDKLLALAEAGSIGVVLALLNNVHPGVETLGDFSRARKRLGRDNSSGSVNSLLGRGRRNNCLALCLGLGLDGGSVSVSRCLAGLDGLSASLSLRDGADRGANRNRHGNDLGATRSLDRALSDLRSAAGDGLDRGGEDS